MRSPLPEYTRISLPNLVEIYICNALNYRGLLKLGVLRSPDRMFWTVRLPISLMMMTRVCVCPGVITETNWFWVDICLGITVPVDNPAGVSVITDWRLFRCERWNAMAWLGSLLFVWPCRHRFNWLEIQANWFLVGPLKLPISNWVFRLWKIFRFELDIFNYGFYFRAHEMFQEFFMFNLNLKTLPFFTPEKIFFAF